MIDRELLARLCQGAASGAALAADMGISRSAVWKRIEALRAAGVDIQALAGRGYALARPLNLLDAEKIRAAMGPAALAELSEIDLRFEIDSSNALALREPAPERGSQVFLCERQTAGRGRRGRQWQSPLAAHLYLTVSRRFDGGVARLQGLSLAVGVAVAQALHHLGYVGVELKWPNDLVVAGNKLGGILIEIGGDASGPVRVAIGLGLNIAMPAQTARKIDQPWCDLAGLAKGAAPARNVIAGAVLDHLLPALAQFEREGLAPFLDHWPPLDALAGKAVRIIEREQECHGVACGVASDGSLRVAHDGVERRFHGGEVSVRTR